MDEEVYWSEEYLICAEMNFDTVIDKMFEDEFIDRMIGSHESMIEKDDFIYQIRTKV